MVGGDVCPVGRGSQLSFERCYLCFVGPRGQRLGNLLKRLCYLGIIWESLGGGVGEGEGGKDGGDHGEFLTYHCGFWVSFILSFSVWVGRVGLFGLQKWPALKTHTHSFLPPYTKLHTDSTLDLLSFSFSLGSALFFLSFFCCCCSSTSDPV